MYNRGTKYLVAGNAAKALQFFKKQVPLKEFKELYLNMGNAYRLLGNDKEAIRCYEKANDPRLPFVDGRYGEYDLALSNLGLMRYMYGRDADAIALYERAIKLNPKHYDALWNYASAELRNGLCSGGDEGIGWKLYEYRFLRSNAVIIDRTLPIWDGISKHEVIVVLAEQGLGDKLMWGRYISKLKEYCSRLVVQCPPGMEQIFAEFETCTSFAIEGDAVGVPICSLAGRFGLIPGDWLKGKFGARTLSLDNSMNLNIGVEWVGSPTHANDRNRSVTVNYIRALSKYGNLFSLKPGAKDIPGIKALNPKNWGETAEYVNGLDLVISIDTSLVHLCGSLGKECWMVQPLKETDFRWGTDKMGESNVWYDSVKVIRNPGSWDKTFDKVYKKLDAELSRLKTEKIMKHCEQVIKAANV